MPLTFAEIVDQVKVNHGNRTGDPQWNDTRYKRLVRISEERISAEYVLPELICRSMAPTRVFYDLTDPASGLGRYNADFMRYLPIGGPAFGGFETTEDAMTSGTDGKSLLIRSKESFKTGTYVYVFGTRVAVFTSVQTFAATAGSTIVNCETVDNEIQKFFGGDTVKIQLDAGGYHESIVAGVATAPAQNIDLVVPMPSTASIGKAIILTKPLSRVPPVELRRITDESDANQRMGVDGPLARSYQDGNVLVMTAAFVPAILALEVQPFISQTIYTPLKLGDSEWNSMIAAQIGEPDTSSGDGPSYFRVVQFRESIRDTLSLGGPPSQVIEMWPPFNGLGLTYRATYLRRVKPMSKDEDQSELLDRDMAIIAMASHLAFQGTGAGEDAARWFAVFGDTLSKVQKAQAERPKIRGPAAPANLPRAYSGTPWADPFVRK